MTQKTTTNLKGNQVLTGSAKQKVVTNNRQQKKNELAAATMLWTFCLIVVLIIAPFFLKDVVVSVDMFRATRIVGDAEYFNSYWTADGYGIHSEEGWAAVHKAHAEAAEIRGRYLNCGAEIVSGFANLNPLVKMVIVICEMAVLGLAGYIVIIGRNIGKMAFRGFFPNFPRKRRKKVTRK